MIDGTDFEVPFDNMIVAISENVDYSLFGDTMPELDKRGRIFVDSLQQTSLPGVFLAGDFLTGPETVVAAVASAKTAVEGITLTHNQ
jgi:NADPH-dependent glutamate synthase beta subunit-like oxidoreductase